MIKPKQWVEPVNLEEDDLDYLGAQEGDEIGEIWCMLSSLQSSRSYLNPDFAEAVEKEIKRIMKDIEDNWRWFCEEEITATARTSKTRVHRTLLHVDHIDIDNCE